jgi:2'-5' RNA ligase
MTVMEFPLWLPDGREAETVGQVAALLGCSTRLAAKAILEHEDASEELKLEAKDVYGGAASSPVVFGIGSVLSTLGTIERPKRKRKRRRKKKDEEDKAIKVHCEVCDTDYFVDSMDEIDDHKASHGDKRLRGDDADHTEDVCIMLEPAHPEQMAIEGGMKPSELHCTIAYYGESSDLDAKESSWVKTMQILVDKTPPITAMINGITRFSGQDSDPIVLNVDSPSVENLRNLVLGLFGQPRSEHGFSPHLTIAYADREDDLPIKRYEPHQMVFDRITLAWGNRHHTFKLDGRKSMSIQSVIDRAGEVSGTETKVRHVRTAAGARRFGQPIGSVIVRDRVLSNLTAMTSEWDDWAKMKDSKGREYYIGKDGDGWVATDADDNDVVHARTEDSIYEALDAHVGGATKRKGKKTSFHPDDLSGAEKNQYQRLTLRQKDRYATERRNGASHKAAVKTATEAHPVGPQKPTRTTPKPKTRETPAGRLPDAPRGFRRIPRGYEATIDGDLVTIKKTGSKWKVSWPGDSEWDETFPTLDGALGWAKGGWRTDIDGGDMEGSALPNTSGDKKWDKVRNIAWRVDQKRGEALREHERAGKGHWEQSVESTPGGRKYYVKEYIDHEDNAVLFTSAGPGGSFTTLGKRRFQPPGTGRYGSTGQGGGIQERQATPEEIRALKEKMERAKKLASSTPKKKVSAPKAPEPAVVQTQRFKRTIAKLDPDTQKFINDEIADGAEWRKTRMGAGLFSPDGKEVFVYATGIGSTGMTRVNVRARNARYGNPNASKAKRTGPTTTEKHGPVVASKDPDRVAEAERLFGWKPTKPGANSWNCWNGKGGKGCPNGVTHSAHGLGTGMGGRGYCAPCAFRAIKGQRGAYMTQGSSGASYSTSPKMKRTDVPKGTASNVGGQIYVGKTPYVDTVGTKPKTKQLEVA